MDELEHKVRASERDLMILRSDMAVLQERVKQMGAMRWSIVSSLALLSAVMISLLWSDFDRGFDRLDDGLTRTEARTRQANAKLYADINAKLDFLIDAERPKER